MISDCARVQERLVDYWEDATDPKEKREIEEHLAGCASCSEEFRLWEESSKLIRDLQLEEDSFEEIVTAEEVNRNVMNRIYAEQSWFMPAARRSYSFTAAFRMKVGGLLAGLLAVFLCGFGYALFQRMSGSNAPVAGVMETADAYGAGGQLSKSMFVDVPVASLSDPIVLRVNPVMPEYWIAFSLLGVLLTLLILNWFTRVRA